MGAMLVAVCGFAMGFVITSLLSLSSFLFLGLEHLALMNTQGTLGGDKQSKVHSIVVDHVIQQDDAVYAYSGGELECSDFYPDDCQARKVVQRACVGDEFRDVGINGETVIVDENSHTLTSPSSLPLKKPPGPVFILPPELLALLCVLMFSFTGLYFAMASWLATYSSAALLVSYYFMALLVSSLLSVPLAAKITHTSIMRGLTVTGAVAVVLFFVLYSKKTLWAVLIPSMLLGICLAPLLTLCLRLPVAYKFGMSDESTSAGCLWCSDGL